MADQETRLARHGGAAHRGEDVADQAPADARIEDDRHPAAPHRARIKPRDRATARFGADAGGIGQVFRMARASEMAVGLHPPALARDDAGRDRMAARFVPSRESSRCREGDDAVRAAGSAAIGIGDAGDGPCRILRLQRALAQLFGRGFARIEKVEIEHVAREQPVLRGEPGVAILRCDLRHRKGAFRQCLECLGAEIAGVDRSGSLAHEDPQPDRFAFRTIDRFELAEPYLDSFRCIGAHDGVGRVGAHPARHRDQVLAAGKRRIAIDHARSTPHRPHRVRVGWRKRRRNRAEVVRLSP